MRDFSVTLRNPTGLHARPAKRLANTAKKFKAAVSICNGSKRANAKSMISVLTLGVKCGMTIRFEIDGEDEIAAAIELEELVRGGLGELDSPILAAAPPSVVQQSAVAEHVAAGPLATDGPIRGVPAASGIAIGPAFRWQRAVLAVDEVFTNETKELERLRHVLGVAKKQIVALRDRVSDAASEGAEIIESHLGILEDPDLWDAVQSQIGTRQTAFQAWNAGIEHRATLMAGLDDPLLASRAADVRDVGHRVACLLANKQEASSARWPEFPVVVVADDLSPSETVSLSKDRVLGICTSGGGPTAHFAIIARNLGIPAVVGAGKTVLEITNETTVILDGNAGTLVVAPSKDTLALARETQEALHAQRKAEIEQAEQPAITRDGHRVKIVANIGSVEDARQARRCGAEGVGLLRTEFLFLDRATAPTEQEQFEVYRDIALAMEERPVVIRTLDVGGDKPLPYAPLPPETNPFLGIRGLRFCLEHPELLREQLRAILRASAFGRLLILFPMVTDLFEWRAARTMVEELRAEMDVPPVELGIMIEVPAAALQADMFAAEVDFFSIGTNDLTQYTLAVDRMHSVLASRAIGPHPAVLRLIAEAIDAAHRAGKWVGVCGELGCDPKAVPLLVGLGVDELSVSVPAIPAIKSQVRTLDRSTCQQRRPGPETLGNQRNEELQPT